MSDDAEHIDAHIVVDWMGAELASGTVHAVSEDGRRIAERQVWMTIVGVEVGLDRTLRLRGYMTPASAREMGKALNEAAALAQGDP